MGIWKTSSWLIWEQCELLQQASKNNYHHKGFISRLNLYKVYASFREWFTQIAMSNKVVLGRAGDLPWDKGEVGASGSAIAIYYTFTRDEVFASGPVPRCLPNTSKRGYVVSYEKKKEKKKASKCNQPLNSSLLQKQWHTRIGAVYVFGSEMMEGNRTKNWQGAAVLARMGFGHVELKEHMMKFLRWNVIFHPNKQI